MVFVFSVCLLNCGAANAAVFASCDDVNSGDSFTTAAREAPAKELLGTESPGTESPGTGSIIQGIESGLGGTWRVGYTTQHRISVKGKSGTPMRAEIQTVDGDGVLVNYSDTDWIATPVNGQTSTIVVYAKHGRPDRSITVRLIDAESGELLETRSLTESERGTAIPSEQPWVVGIGKADMGLDVVAARSVKAGLPDYTATELTEARLLPSHPLGWAGVDLLIISSSNPKLLSELTEAQSRAIRKWIQSDSGRCVLTLGLNAEAFFSNHDLAQLVTGTWKGVEQRSSPGPLESYLNSDSRLESLGSAVIQLSNITADLEGQGSARNRFPLIARWASGLGKVKFFAGEIDSDSIKEWAGRPLLLKRLMSDQWDSKPSSSGILPEDLSVQVHGSLDRFPKLQIGNLTQMSVFVFVLLVLLGPLDYFLVVKKWRSPRGSWLTLILAALGGCGLLVYLQARWKPTASTVNQTEIVDWDLGTNMVHGRAFAHLYGGKRGMYDIRWMPTQNSLLTRLQGNFSSRIEWFGMPGKSIGGFLSPIGTDRLLPEYRIARSDEQTIEINGLAIPEAGTKAIMSSWSAALGETPKSDLRAISGAIDLLTGTVVNPLPSDLIGSMLFYRGRFYSLPTRFAAGDSLQLSVNNVPKDIARRLQRRVSVDGKDQGTPWNPADLTDLKRISEILLFHKAAGGGSYTIGQENRYLAWLDQSDLLKTDRAILFGELENRQVDWSISRNGEAVELEPGFSVSLARIILPVVKTGGSQSSGISSSSTSTP